MKRIILVATVMALVVAALPTLATAAETFHDVVIRNTDEEPVPVKLVVGKEAANRVEVSNFPDPPETQEVRGTVSVANLPDTQRVTGDVTVRTAERYWERTLRLSGSASRSNNCTEVRPDAAVLVDRAFVTAWGERGGVVSLMTSRPDIGWFELTSLILDGPAARPVAGSTQVSVAQHVQLGVELPSGVPLAVCLDVQVKARGAHGLVVGRQLW